MNDKLPALMAEFIPLRNPDKAPVGDPVRFDVTYDFLQLSVDEIRLWKPNDGPKLLVAYPEPEIEHEGPYEIRVDPQSWLSSMGIRPSRFSMNNLKTLRARWEEGSFDVDTPVSRDRPGGWTREGWVRGDLGNFNG